MRYRSLMALGMIAAMPAFAQEQKQTAILTTPREKLHELGAFAQLYPDDNGTDLLGLQYTRWKNEHQGIKFIAAYGSYNSLTSRITVIIPDTIMMRKSQTKINLGIVGAGLTRQYHVNKNLYLFGAIELKGGYGSGSVDTTTIKQYVEDQMARETSGNLFHDQNVSMLYIAVTPSVGFKFQGKRICAGIEILPMEMNYTSKHYSKGRPDDLMDFNFGILQQRFFVTYRF